MAKRRLLCVILALSLAVAAGSPACLAETASTANPPPQGRPAQQPVFCFQGAAPDRQEAGRYADRAQRDASRASKVKAGDLDDTVFVVGLVIFGVAVIVGGFVLAAHGI